MANGNGSVDPRLQVTSNNLRASESHHFPGLLLPSPPTIEQSINDKPSDTRERYAFILRKRLIGSWVERERYASFFFRINDSVGDSRIESRCYTTVFICILWEGGSDDGQQLHNNHIRSRLGEHVFTERGGILFKYLGFGNKGMKTLAQAPEEVYHRIVKAAACHKRVHGNCTEFW